MSKSSHIESEVDLVTGKLDKRITCRDLLWKAGRVIQSVVCADRASGHVLSPRMRAECLPTALLVDLARPRLVPLPFLPSLPFI